MQDEDFQIQNENKAMLLSCLGDVVYEHRLISKKGINKFSFEYDIGNGLLSKLEKGTIDTKFTTLWKLANAFGYQNCSDFIKIIETRLPKDFNFYK